MRRRKKHLKYYFLGGLLLATVFVWYMVFVESRSGLTVHFLDVGQGDAIFIESPNGNQILIDGGQNKKVLAELGKVMPFYDRSIDLVMESHPDRDHIGGLVGVLERYSVGAVVESGVSSDSPVYKELNKVVEEKEVQKILARRGQRINFGDGVYMDILFPDRDVSGLKVNDASIVARLVYGDNSFLFTGDSPQKMEKYLISLSPEDLNVDVLKVGHHGSRTSSSESFVGYTSPTVAIISVGKDNSYGHPHKEVLDILKKFGVEVLRTSELGTITIKSDGENLVVRKK